MALTEQIQADLKAAMKARDAATTSALRGLLAELKTASVAEGAAGEVSQADAIDLLSKEAKKRQESIDAYERAGRQDLAERERFELEVVRRYLPSQLDETELGAIVDEAIAETGASEPSELGQVMSAVMPRVKGRADGKRVNEMVRERLGG